VGSTPNAGIHDGDRLIPPEAVSTHRSRRLVAKRLGGVTSDGRGTPSFQGPPADAPAYLLRGARTGQNRRLPGRRSTIAGSYRVRRTADLSIQSTPAGSRPTISPQCQAQGDGARDRGDDGRDAEPVRTVAERDATGAGWVEAKREQPPSSPAARSRGPRRRGLPTGVIGLCVDHGTDPFLAGRHPPTDSS
jgi:hypothetical protein